MSDTYQLADDLEAFAKKYRGQIPTEDLFKIMRARGLLLTMAHELQSMRQDTDEQARILQALAEEIRTLRSESAGEVVVTTRDGQCVAVTRQDEGSKILSVIWERP